MAISFVTAKPGGGKSYFGVKQICWELQHTNRFIVTNLPLKLDELADWCHKNTQVGSESLKRLRVLDDNESLEFWLYPAPGMTITGRKTQKSLNREIDGPDWDERDKKHEGGRFPGVLFVIDEVHVFFGARSWAKNGTDCTTYLSMHRKLWDDVFLISQHKDQVDKALRRLCQDYTVLKNLEKTRVLGFKIPKTCRRATYADENSREPVESGFFRFNFEEFGNLYDTTAGVGIAGRGEVKEKDGGGRHPAWAVVFLVLIIAAVWFVPRWVFGAASNIANQSIRAAYASGTNMVKFAAGTNVLGSAKPPAGTTATATNQSLKVELLRDDRDLKSVATQSTNKPTELTIVRRVIVGPARQYWLSDGSVVRQGDANLQFAGEDYVILRGGRIVWRRQ